MFNGITDTICELESTIRHLKKLQQKAEQALLDADGEGEDTPGGKAD